MNKAKRRDAILDATVALFGEHAAHDVTTDQIAKVAGVAPATVYNLVGTRDDVARAVVSRVLSELAESLSDLDPTDPIAAAQLVVDQTVRRFVADSRAFRQIVRLAPQPSSDRDDLVDPSSFQVAAMRRAQTMGIVRADVDPDALGRQIYLSYSGAMNLWSTGRLDDEGFAVAAQHGLFTALAAAAGETHRNEFLGRMRALDPALEQAWTRGQRSR